MTGTRTMLRRGLLAWIAWSFVVVAPSRADERAESEDRAIENLAAFARLSGYVRFFHPSDQAASVDWDKVGVMGAEAVRGAADREALRAALLRVLRPIAPSMRLADPAPPATAEGPPASLPTGERLTFWQHAGIDLGNQRSPYSQRRVITGETQGARAPLFEPATPPASFTKTIAPGLVLRLPLALPVMPDGTTAESRSPEFDALQAELANVDLRAITAADWRLRVAGVATIGGVFQHFQPDLDGIGVRWDETLEPALRRALRDRDADDYWETLSELVAKSQDGHGYVYGRPVGAGGIPIRVAVVEERIVVTGVADGAPFRKGDVIEKIDGTSGLEVLRERERYAAGSPHLRRFRALNQFGEGAVGSVARVEIVRDGAPQTVEFTRVLERRGYFFNSVGEFEFPAFAEVRPGIFYVNLHSLDGPEFDAKLPQLAGARGVIFDWRSDGRRAVGKPVRRLLAHVDIIPHLIDQTVQASPMLVPQVSVPDRAGWTYRESTWPVEPKAPRLAGRVVFIDDPAVVSYGETCMAMIADYRLATLVGAPTAGCNGNANYVPLPGGLRVMWTGMDVRKHDRSSFYTVGFVPDVPVTRTLRGVIEGRDEDLERAIEVIERERAGPTSPK